MSLLTLEEYGSTVFLNPESLDTSMRSTLEHTESPSQSGSMDINERQPLFWTT
jgi:hypothetical protein